MKIRKKICIIVDAYSTGSALAGLFSGYGYTCVHVQSSQHIPVNLVKSFRASDFIENILHQGRIEEIYAHITAKNFEVICVVPGAESGVELADILSERFKCVSSNGTELSKARRDKYLMAQAVKNAGVATVDFFKSNDVEEILNWVKRYNAFASPIVLKPLKSSSTDGFHICHNEQDVRDAFSNLHATKNIFNELNHEILVQNYLDGQEYCVNTISVNGKHYIAEVWHINKKIVYHSKMYDRMTLVTEEAPEFNLLVRYTEQVLNALHIKFGPAHTELILTKDKGPILLETAARMMGALDLSLITQAINTNVALLTAEAYLTPDLFLHRLDQARPKIKMYPFMIHLIANQEGILDSYCLDNLRKLKTFYGMDTYKEPGAEIKKTVDTLTTPGVIFLCSNNILDLERDYQTIRQMEARGEIYKIVAKEDLANNTHGYSLKELPLMFNVTTGQPNSNCVAAPLINISGSDVVDVNLLTAK